MKTLVSIATLSILLACSSDESGTTAGGGGAGATGGGATASGASGPGGTAGSGGMGGNAGSGGGIPPIDCGENPSACPEGYQCYCGGPAAALCECAAPCDSAEQCTNPEQPVCCPGVGRGTGLCTTNCGCYCD
jgi:hypothetical protein